MKIVVVSPHPDDETLGAGGFILKHKRLGDEVYWINMTDVEESDFCDDYFKTKRKFQIKQICDFYKFDGFYNLKFIPSTLEDTSRGELIEAFCKCIQKIQPEWIILPNPDDAHGDHLMTYNIGMICSKVFRYPYVKRIMTMEIISETDFSKSGTAFSPNYYVNIEDVLEDKLQAMSIYDTELQEAPFPRNLESIRALAMLRGVASGFRYAEAFRMIKQIEV